MHQHVCLSQGQFCYLKLLQLNGLLEVIPKIVAYKSNFSVHVYHSTKQKKLMYCVPAIQSAISSPNIFFSSLTQFFT